MARSRNIKPGFFLNDELAQCEPLARLLFAGLWTIADREGRLRDRPQRIKAETLPYDDCNITNLLNQLEDKSFITRYQVNNESYIVINNWYKHQNPHWKEVDSDLPAPLTLNHIKPNVEVTLDQPCTLIPDSGFLIPDSLNPHTDIERFIKDIQKFTNRIPWPSNKTGSKDLTDAKRGIGELITEHGYDKVLKTAEQIHADDRTWSLLAFEWKIRERLSNPKGCQLPQPFNRRSYSAYQLRDCGCSDCVTALERRKERGEDY
jgi:hypothetical protein